MLPHAAQRIRRCARAVWQESERRLRLVSTAILGGEGRFSARAVAREFGEWSKASGRDEAPAALKGFRGLKKGAEDESAPPTALTYCEVDRAFRALSRAGEKKEYETITFRHAVVARTSSVETANAVGLDADQMFAFINTIDADGDGRISLKDLQQSLRDLAASSSPRPESPYLPRSPSAPRKLKSAAVGAAAAMAFASPLGRRSHTARLRGEGDDGLEAPGTGGACSARSERDKGG